MTIQEAIKARHAVRSYTDRPIEQEKIDELTKLMNDINAKSGLHIQLVLNDPKAFDNRLAHYGKFSGVNNYFAIIGSKKNAKATVGETSLDEIMGYWGEHLVLKAQMLGLNTCWVGMTFKKNPAVLQMNDGEKVRCVIPVGYGTTQGVSHPVKAIDKVTKLKLNQPGEAMPEWFRKGIEAALLAPTAVNQQKFKFSLIGEKYVHAKAGLGFFSKVDLGIAKYHFEIGAGKDHFEWV